MGRKLRPGLAHVSSEVLRLSSSKVTKLRLEEQSHGLGIQGGKHQNKSYPSVAAALFGPKSSSPAELKCGTSG